MNKPKVLFLGITQEIVNAIVKGTFENMQLLAAMVNNSNLQGRVIPYQDQFLFTVKPNEMNKFNYDFIIVVPQNEQEINPLVSQLANERVALEKIRVYNNGQLLSIQTNRAETQVEVLPPPPSMLMKRPKLFFDVTEISRSLNQVSGIGRMMRSLYRNLNVLAGQDIMSIQWQRDNVITGRKFESYVKNQKFDNKEYQMDLQPNDKLLAGDGWSAPPIYNYFARKTNSLGIITYAIIYDLIPVRLANYPQVFLNMFKPFIDCVLQNYSKVICISRTVADDVIAYFKESKFSRNKSLEVYYCYLGFEIEKKSGSVRKPIKNFVNRARTFLMVGSIAGHKNHITALKAFKNIVEHHRDKNIQLLVIGKPAWGSEDFLHLLSSDEQLQKRVLLVNDASDVELQWAYKHSEALIFGSLIEGFGLPLVEAAYFKLPIICSDIPIFHEIAEDNVIYFPPLDVEALKNILLNWDNLKSTVDPSKIKLYSWRECAQEILAITEDKIRPYKVLD